MNDDKNASGIPRSLDSGDTYPHNHEKEDHVHR